MKRMYVLISNDDGITSKGLFALVNEIKQVAEVVVVAPDSQKSAVSHAITVNDPLKVEPFEINEQFFGYAVNGTPVDCVKLAVRNLLKKKPDIVISGINHGTNTSLNAIYSGTVSASAEAALLDIPSFAISLATYKSNPDYSFVAKFAREFFHVFVENRLPTRTILNINVPAVKEEEIRGVKITKMNNSTWEDIYEERKDPQNKPYYWLTGKYVMGYEDNTYDDYALHNNFISITPLQYDLTNHDFYSKILNWELDYFNKTNKN
jgi:5'-nucleotidase